MPKPQAAQASQTELAPAQTPPTSDESIEAAPPPAPVIPLVRPVADDAPWQVRLEALGLSGLVKQLAMNCLWAGLEAELVKLTLDVKAKHLLTENHRNALQAALAEQIGKPVQLQIDTGIGALDTPAAQFAAAQAAKLKQAQQSIIQDASVQAFAEHFGAVLRPGSIKVL